MQLPKRQYMAVRIKKYNKAEKEIPGTIKAMPGREAEKIIPAFTFFRYHI